MVTRRDVQIEELVGLTMKSVKREGQEILLTTDSGRRFVMKHEQDCCESVEIESITGDLADLVGSPILLAEESTNHESPKDAAAESFTWTFYKLATVKGWVDIRWYGESSGYYSESISIEEILPTWEEQRLFGLI
jgi:hypothetical protein